MNIKTISISVNYCDLLSYTWELNKTEIDNYTIISDSKDIDTHNFCKQNNINLFVTDSFYAEDSKFSKSNALNEFFQNIDIESTEWILLLDSDIVVNNVINEFKKNFYEQALDSIIIPSDVSVGTGIPVFIGNKQDKKTKSKILYKDSSKSEKIHGPNDVLVNECLFSCPREIYLSDSDYQKKTYTFEACFFYGYFHLFHIDAIKEKLMNRESIFGTYKTAARYDMDFARSYWAFLQKKTLRFPVHHLGPIAQNWEGRETSPWRK